jgi:hypothetical protein
MKYIGNYKDWLDPKTLEIMLTTPGEKRPLESEADEYRKSAVYKKWVEAGYDYRKLSWQFYFDDHVGWLDPPLETAHKFKWWFSKMNPGEMFPLHIDSFPDEEKNVKRYWMACQDRDPGHIFIYKDTQLDWKAGDLYLFDEAREWHGTANIGFVPKISYQLVIFE